MLGRCAIYSGIVVLLVLFSQVSSSKDNPIIGIFCHELTPTHGCYIPASDVKAVEAAGARVAPIFLWQPNEYYRKIVRHLNGVLFPGGDAAYDVVGGYYQSAELVYHYALELNSNGSHFPVLGICLGHEFLSRYSSGQKALRPCPGMEYVMLSLQFVSEEGSLYSTASSNIKQTLSTQNVTVNYHDLCVSPDEISPRWRVLTLNQDGAGVDFVSSMQDRTAPIVGVQFHPEKNAYEWQKKHPHYKDALLASRHFFDWLVTEASQNNHSFSDPSEELNSLIYNYSPTFTGRNGTDFEQIYIFPQSAGKLFWEPSVKLVEA